MDRRGFLVAVGDGALAGLAVGVVLGLLRVERHADLEHGTHLLAAWRVLVPALSAGAAGATLAAAFLPLARSARGTARGAAVGLWAGGLVALGTIARDRVLAAPFDSRPKLHLVALGVLALLWSVFWAARLFDAGRPGRFARLRGATAALGLLAFVAATVGAGLAARVERARGDDRPNILLVSIDTMRADALGALGGHGGTPILDRLASEGALFEQAMTVSPWTLPSHASIFTSLLPFDHGVRFSPHRLGASLDTLAERLRDAGYRTGAFAGDAYVDSSFGFDQGFDLYVDFHEDSETGPQPIVDAALRWIRRGGKRPFFAFVHTYEPHLWYTETDLADPADRGDLYPIIRSEDVEKFRSREIVLSERQKKYVRDVYAGDVARADRIVGGMIEALRADGTLDRTILIVLSDHGEDLWDHDLGWSPGHGHTLYQDILRVPLFFRAPGRVAPGTRLKTPVSVLDVSPTILALGGLAPPAAHQGRDLSKSLRSGSEPAVAPVWAESVEYGPDRFAVREGRWKAIVVPRPDVVHSEYRPEVKPLEVFDLESDPEERTDRSAEPNEATLRLVRMVTDRALAKLDLDASGELRDEPSEELLRTLRSLGYLR